MDKLEFFNKIKLLISEFYKNNPCQYCVGNGCDDCRDCPGAENRYTMETNIYNLIKEYENLYGSNYNDDYNDYLKDKQNTKTSKSVTTYKKILKEWCEENMSTHTDWTGTRVETKNSCLTIDEFIDKLWNYLEKESDKID